MSGRRKTPLGRRLGLPIAAAILAYAGYAQREGASQTQDGPPPAASADAASSTELSRAIASRARDVPVTGEGVVTRLLPDDDRGSRHQRFVLRLASGTTLLVAHNIDLAPRIAPLAEGDTVAFRGEYVWNDRGGVLHWTHHDPDGRHPGGWLRHRGRTYE
jgi:hypothetical protein